MCTHPGREESREAGTAAGKAVAVGGGAAAGARGDSAESSQAIANAQKQITRQEFFMDTNQTCFPCAGKDRFFDESNRILARRLRGFPLKQEAPWQQRSIPSVG